MYKQEDVPGKGRGLVAATDLSVGTVLITEQPLMVAKPLTSGGSMDEIIAAFEKLSNEEKEKVLCLHDPGINHVSMLKLLTSKSTYTEADEKILRIFFGNSIDLCSHEEMNVNKSGLYPTISLINHSCVPNVVWSWLLADRSRRVKQVKVIREIKEGEEILASYCHYIDIFPTKAERRRLLMNWNFNCQCKLCSLTGEELKANDGTRKEIAKLHEDVKSLAEVGLLEQSLNASKKKVGIMKSIKEEVILNFPIALMECCDMAAHCKKFKQLNAERLMNKAKQMSEQYGDCFIFNYQKKEVKVKKLLRNI